MFELINLNVLYDCWSTVAAKGHFLTLCEQTGSVCSPVTVGVRDLLNNQSIDNVLNVLCSLTERNNNITDCAKLC